MNRPIKCLFLALTFVQFASSTCLSQVSLNLDLYKLTLNGSSIKEFTVDKVTNLLGRPTASESNQLISEVLGPRIFYHNKGLSFWFKSKNDDPQQRLFSISINLVKTWDEDYNEFYVPFPGSLNPKLTPNHKLNSIVPLFKNYTVVIQTAEERRKELEPLAELGVKTNNTDDIIRIKNTNASINISCEEVTKFLESISIIFE
jgi:hypothetical protein